VRREIIFEKDSTIHVRWSRRRSRRKTTARRRSAAREHSRTTMISGLRTLENLVLKIVDLK
jgi:hypothetical protein